MKRRNLLRACLAATAALVAVGFVVPDKPVIPVEGASSSDWNPKSFWFEPWGASGVHKGIDIFAPNGRRVLAAAPGIVVYQGELRLGGNVLAVLGPKWRIHYYAHLADRQPRVPLLVSRAAPIGAIGTSGNAAGKPSHLHYAIVSVIPLPWRYSSASQGWKQMFFLNPDALLTRNRTHGA